MAWVWWYGWGGVWGGGVWGMGGQRCVGGDDLFKSSGGDKWLTPFGWVSGWVFQVMSPRKMLNIVTDLLAQNGFDSNRV